MNSTRVCSFADNYLDAKAAEHLSKGLKENKALTSLKYAIAHHFLAARAR